MCSACKGAHYCSMECQKERLVMIRIMLITMRFLHKIKSEMKIGLIIGTQVALPLSSLFGDQELNSQLICELSAKLFGSNLEMLFSVST